MAKAKESSKKESAPRETAARETARIEKASPGTTGLLFELENVALGGRTLAFEVLKNLFAERDVKLDRVIFMRHCLSPCPKEYLPKLLEEVDRKRLSADKFVGEIKAAMTECLDDSGVTMAPGLAKLLAKAADRGIARGALTSLPEELAMRLMTRMGLDTAGVHLLALEATGNEFPTADAWLKLAKKMGLPRTKCTGLATSAQSCRAALSAGMRCVALPDEFTAFQDFAGADMISDKLEGDAVERAISVAASRQKK